MPTIHLSVNIEKASEGMSFKRFLDHVNFDVYSSKEDDTNFTMIIKTGAKKLPISGGSGESTVFPEIRDIEKMGNVSRAAYEKHGSGGEAIKVKIK